MLKAYIIPNNPKPQNHYFSQKKEKGNKPCGSK